MALSDKFEQYQDFMENRLKVDLKEIEEVLDKKMKAYMEWEDLKQTCEVMNRIITRDKQVNDVNLQVPIGNGVYVNAEALEYDKVLVNIGLNCHLELNYEEAKSYANIRMRALQREIDHYRELAAKVKANIKVVLLGIDELKKEKTK